MDKPKVKEGDWIIIGQRPNPFLSDLRGYVLAVQDDLVEVGYYQNNIIEIKAEVIWDGAHWQFKTPPPHGTYVHGPKEAIIKKGPRL